MPVTEAERLRVLHELNVLDTPRSPALDDLCAVAARLFEVPMAFVTLLDRDRQWFKATYGADFTETSRSLSFCTHTIAETGVMVVPDASADQRFSRHPQVEDGMIRFYAGAPLEVRPGLNLGSVCLLDSRPREFSPDEAETLTRFARIAMALLREDAAGREARRRRAESARQARDLWRQHRIMAQTEHLAGVGGWELPVGEEIARWSDGVYRIAGLPLGTSMTNESVMDFFAPDDRPRLTEGLKELARQGKPMDLVLEGRTVSGETRWIRITGEREMVDGVPTRLFGVAQDITERRAAETELWRMANHDALTGLANRLYFQKRFEEALVRARRQGSRLALLFLDLDHFKEVNDTRGHGVGDEFIRETARRLQDNLRPGDRVSRQGGDEFAVLLDPVRDAEEALAVAQRLHEVMLAPFAPLGEKLAPSVSIGVALYPEHGGGVAELLQNADLALYRAKEDGRARVRLFDQGERLALESRLDEVSFFRRALEEGQVEMHYQPQIRLSDGKLSGFEALARWRLPDGSIRPAAEFSQALEDPDSLILVGELALRRSVELLKSWKEAGLVLPRLSVNVGGAELTSCAYAERAARMLEENGIALDRLGVEVTERVLLGGREDAVEKSIRALHGLGIGIALDDFGTGFASLVHLKRCPVDQIKIDRSFVADLTGSRQDGAIVKAIISMAHDLGIETVAEGVETRTQLSCLAELGCDHAQGYLLEKAVPPARATAMLAEGFRFPMA